MTKNLWRVTASLCVSCAVFLSPALAQTNTNTQAKSSQKTVSKTAPKKTAQKKTTKKTVKVVAKKTNTKKAKQLAQKKLERLQRAYEATQVKLYENIPISLPLIAETGKKLKAKVAYAVDLETGQVLLDKNSHIVQPIASITKLMTALVIRESGVDLNERFAIHSKDVDRKRGSSSHLRVGTMLSRHDMMWLALMSSENRAAHALARTFPSGKEAFVQRMNAKAKELGMTQTTFVDPTGLSAKNISSPKDLVKLLEATQNDPLIRKLSTSDELKVRFKNGGYYIYHNSNRLIRNKNWDIDVSKTGYIHEAGECLVMVSKFEGRSVAIVILNAYGKATRFADAVRLRRLVQNDFPAMY